MRLVFKANGIFVTATGTEIGKTYVSCAVARELVARGMDVGIMKPFASGATKKQNGRWISEDVQELRAAAPSHDSVELQNPYCFKAPLAPYSASLLEKRPIRMEKVYAAYKTLRARHKFMIVEGVGGVRVPITDKIEVADFALRINLPTIVVVSAKLGTLNHTLLTLDYLRLKKIRILGVVLNFFDANSLTDRTNLQFFRRKKIPVLAALPQLSQN